MRYQVIKDFQYTDEKHQIMILPAAQILSKVDKGIYAFKIKSKEYAIPEEVVIKNPVFFKAVDWRDDLMSYMKEHKRSTVPANHKIVVEFFDTFVLNGKDVVDQDDMKDLLMLVRDKYNMTSDKRWIDIFDKLGYGFDNDKIWKKF
jgi:hypothetical protein